MIHAGSAAGGAVLRGGDLAASGAVGAGETGRARPAVQHPAIRLTFMPWWIHWDTAGRTLLQEAAARFEQSHPGLSLTARRGPQGGGISSGAVLSAILAGNGPDVVADCCTAWVQYLQAGAFANLDPYLGRDDLGPSSWARGQVQALRTPAGQFGLPVYNGPVVYAYRQDILDDLGLPYPDPAWTWKEAADLWSRCAGEFHVDGRPRHRYGCDFVWFAHQWYALEYLFHGFGGAVMDATRTRARFAEADGLRAAEWVYPLLWDGVLGASVGSLPHGTAAFDYRGGWDIPLDATDYAGLKWSYVPAPRWPAGRATFSTNDFWGLAATGAHVEAAWELLHWLACEDDWQRFAMRTTLLPPSKAALWSEFKTVLEAAAPGLKGRGLEWFVEAAQGGDGYPTEFFRHRHIEVEALLGQTLSQIHDRSVGIAEGLTAAARAVDALQTGGGGVPPAARTEP